MILKNKVGLNNYAFIKQISLENSITNYTRTSYFHTNNFHNLILLE